MGSLFVGFLTSVIVSPVYPENSRGKLVEGVAISIFVLKKPVGEHLVCSLIKGNPSPVLPFHGQFFI